MSKPSLESSKKLLNLLYSSTSKKLSPKKTIITDITTPTISRILYNDQESTTVSDLSLDLSSKLKIAPENALLSLWPHFKSNIVRFKCPNSYITKQDMWKLIPPERNLRYNFRLRPFEMVKKRNGKDMTFMNQYFLVFANQLNAAVYIKETENKVINGITLNFEFVELTKDVLEGMSNPLISDFGKVEEIVNIKEEENLVSDKVFHNFDVLKTWLNPERKNYVIVRNWPFGLNEQQVYKLLWSYRLQGIVDVLADVRNEQHVVLLKFSDTKDADRFIRNYHGRKWDIMQGKSNTRQKELVFYQPLLCETI
ncbi:hypothetical protein G210_2762 [Candida maltosa Xu316]|uniref:BRCA1-associated 2/ETP1 RRM domain-containing protein n=1 Tax=Candida maltosa (strain Xu316) TaxID=1245528 RepID=M3JVN1_CANMX|nr:hypothetical protein G210_2762 [Candida maltosa Xu316]